jgi:hypothetical protein
MLINKNNLQSLLLSKSADDLEALPSTHPTGANQ